MRDRFTGYRTIESETAEQLTNELNRLNKNEYDYESEHLSGEYDSWTAYRWKPAGPISFVNGKYVMPVERFIASY